MAQADGVVANGTGSAVRADINGQLAALFTNHSGSTEPATTFAFQTWADTNTNTLKLRNSSNDGWVQLARLDGQFDAKTFHGNITLNAQSDLRLADSDSSNWVAFQAPATVASNVTWTLPAADGTSGQTLQTNGSGTLSWSTPSASVDIISEGNTSAEVVDTGSDGHFKVVTEGTEALRIDSSQRVGIGTTSPQVTLDCNGIIRVPNNTFYQASDGSGGWVELIKADNSNNTQVTNNKGSTKAITFVNDSTERVRIDGSGRLLVGTSSWSNAATLVLQGNSSASNEDAAIRIARGATPGANSDLGLITFGDNSGNVGASIRATNDTASSWGSGDYPGRLTFSTTADGASAPTERMRITQSGAVKITTTGNYVNSSSTSNEIKFSINDIDALTFENTASSPYSININHGTSTNSSSNYFLLCRDQGTQRFGLRTNGGLHNYSGNNVNLSDEREKKNIINLDSTWDCLKHWELKKFHYNEDADTDDLRYGVIAQQVANYCPEVISEWVKQKAEPAKLDNDGNEIEPAKEEIVRMGVKEQQMMWMAIKALQEAQTRIETLEAANAALEARLTALENA